MVLLIQSLFPQLWQVLEGGPSDSSGTWEGNIMLTPLWRAVISFLWPLLSSPASAAPGRCLGPLGLCSFSTAAVPVAFLGLWRDENSIQQMLNLPWETFPWLIHGTSGRSLPLPPSPFLGIHLWAAAKQNFPEEAGRGAVKARNTEGWDSQGRRHGGLGMKRRGGKGWRKFLLEVSSKIYGISEIFLHKGMQFLVHLEMKIAGSVALCTPSGIWNFPGYQEKGRTCWRDLELVHKHVWVHWVWWAGLPSSMSY